VHFLEIVPGDTHTSWKASGGIVSAVFFRLCNKNKLSDLQSQSLLVFSLK
jgi:hypothetical protein